MTHPVGETVGKGHGEDHDDHDENETKDDSNVVYDDDDDDDDDDGDPYVVVVVAIMVYGVSCLYRIMNALWIETQFDPDEYWQTLEPAYCMVFGGGGGDANHHDRQCAHTWEWTRSDVVGSTRLVGDDDHHSSSHPVRSYSSILLTILWYAFIKVCRLDTSWMVSRGPLVVNACLVAAPTDTAVFVMSQQLMRRHTRRHHTRHTRNKKDKNPSTVVWSVLFGNKAMSRMMRQNYCWWPYLCCVTNWFHAYALVRTYSNSVETMLLAVGLALLLGPYFGHHNHRNKNGPRPLVVASLARAKWAFVLGGWSVAIRFTSLSAWIPMGLLLAHQHVVVMHSTKEQDGQTNWRRRLCVGLEFVGFVCQVPALFGALGFGGAMILDRYCFDCGRWVIPAWGSFEFNVLQQKGALYGTHPWHWYGTAGLPAMLGILLLPLLLFGWKQQRQRSRGERTIGWICISYVVTHSCSPHKEFRFILPILPLLCCLAGRSIMDLLDPILQEDDDHTQHPSITTTTTTAAAAATTNHPRRWDKKKNPSRRYYYHRCGGVLMLLLVGNYPHLWFLARFHQRAPIAINRHIVSLLSQPPSHPRHDREDIILPPSLSFLQDPPKKNHVYRIHYLMGCHSTPLYSHLHIPGVAVEAWTLDCSPTCRADPTLQCESDVFSMDPLAFVKRTYPHRDAIMGDLDASLLQQDETTACPHTGPIENDSDRTTVPTECSSIMMMRRTTPNTTKDNVPDFLAAFQTEARQMAPFLESQMGLVPVAQFRHAIRHIRLVDTTTTTATSSSHDDDDAYYLTSEKLIDKDILPIPLPFFVSNHANLEIEFDFMVLFASSTTHT